jgi:hypothetical protein
MASHLERLEEVIDKIMGRAVQASDRLEALADHVREQLTEYGLPGARGGSEGELRIKGLAREKDWDVAYDFAGKKRLLISLKSIWKNPSGVVPNRLDDLMGETANIQQFSPEIVIGYVLLFDTSIDTRRKGDRLLWSEFLEAGLTRIAIRKAPLWNQGLLEAFWFIRIDSAKPKGSRVIDSEGTQVKGEQFFGSLLAELRLREPAIPFAK